MYCYNFCKSLVGVKIDVLLKTNFETYSSDAVHIPYLQMDTFKLHCSTISNFLKNANWIIRVFDNYKSTAE